MPVTAVEVNITAGWKRFAFLFLFAVGLAWVFVRLPNQVRGIQLANVAGDVESLNAALGYDPDLVEVHGRLGFYYLYDPFLFDPSRAVQHFEAAVRLQPFGFEEWTNLGHAYEQRGELAKAERAYQLGIDLGPNYFYPHWSLANFFLRQGEIEPAFREFRRVAEISPDAIDTISQFILITTGGDAEGLVQFSQSLHSPEARGRICLSLLGRGEYERAVHVWKTLPEGPPARREVGHALVAAAIRARRWPLAHSVWHQIMEQNVSPGGIGSPGDLLFWNGDFSHEPAGGGFNWVFRSSPAVEARLDTFEHYRGAQSLLIEFKQHEKVNFRGPSHNLWVEPSSRYRLEFYYKTENLPEVNGVVVELVDAEAPQRLSLTLGPLSNETRWTNKMIVFDTPPETRVLRLSILRKRVGRIYDYVEGRIWFDAFTLEKL